MSLFKDTTVESNHYSLIVCTYCEKQVSYHTKMYSRSVCPHCGHHDGGTVMETRYITLKKITRYPYGTLEFWNKEVTYKGSNPYSQSWLDKNN